MNRRLKIAILGSRGMPNQYGGFEACAEELGVRLVARGHEVTVYCVKNHPLKTETWKGVARVLVSNPEVYMGTAGQFLYDLFCNIHSRKHNFDIVLHLGYTSDSIWQWLWTKKAVNLINMDGQEWKRPKFSSSVRKFLKHAERWATLRCPVLVADSIPIGDYLVEKYHKPVRLISYGAIIPQAFNPKLLASYGLFKKKYDLILARMEPENNIELIIQAKLKSVDGYPLVIIGNESKYKQYLLKNYAKESAIIFLDAIYEADTINSLRHFCRLYIHGHSVGGTNPSLLEAMACSCVIVAHNNPFNKAVLEEDGFYFKDENDLMKLFTHGTASETLLFQANNLKKIKYEYNWDIITEKYEALFFDVNSTQ